MNRIIEIQEPINIIKTYRYLVPEEISNKEFIESIKQCDGEIYEIDSILKDITFLTSNYMCETESHDYESQMIVIDRTANKIVDILQ